VNAFASFLAFDAGVLKQPSGALASTITGT